MDNYSKLIYAASYDRNKAQIYALIRNVIHMTVVIILLLVAFVPEQYAWYFIVSSCLLQFIALIMKLFSLHTHLLSRETQRFALLYNSLGREILSFDITELLRYSHLRKDWEKDATVDAQNYYSSKLNAGPKRFAVNMAESIFFSRSLLESYEKYLAFKLLSYCIIISIVTVCVLASWADPARYVMITAAVSFIIIFFDDIETINAVHKSVKSFESVDRRLHNYLENGIVENEQLTAAFADYAVTSAIAPPIPTYLFVGNRDSGCSPKIGPIIMRKIQSSDDLSPCQLGICGRCAIC